MNVADLKQHLADLAKLLDASGGKQVARDLAAIADGLRPFASQPLPEFARFLGLAHEFQTTGKLSVPPRATRAAARPGNVDPVDVASAIRQLYDRSGDLSLTLPKIEAELSSLAGLTKTGLLVVCERMELAGMKGKKVDAIRAALRQKVLDRRSSAQREQMILSAEPGGTCSAG